MGRSGYVEDFDDNWPLIKWRGQVASVIRGKRGQSFLLEMWNALQALPTHKLITNNLQTEDGDVCAIGAVGKARGVDMSEIDPDDYDCVANIFGVPHQLVQEIVWLNDELWWKATPEERFEKMKRWIEKNLRPVAIVEVDEGSI